MSLPSKPKLLNIILVDKSLRRFTIIGAYIYIILVRKTYILIN